MRIELLLCGNGRCCSRKPRHLGGDSAEVHYLLTIAPNASGLALGANGDSVHRQAILHKVDGRWEVFRLR